MFVVKAVSSTIQWTALFEDISSLVVSESVAYESAMKSWARNSEGAAKCYSCSGGPKSAQRTEDETDDWTWLAGAEMNGGIRTVSERLGKEVKILAAHFRY